MRLQLLKETRPVGKFAKKPEQPNEQQYSEEEQALALVFCQKKPDVTSKEVEEAEKAQDDLEEAVINGDHEAYATEMTAAQLKKQEQKSKYPWDPRGGGNWAQKEIAAMVGVDADRAAARQNLRRRLRQAEEAADLRRSQAPSSTRRVPRQRRAGWRAADAALRAEMAAVAVVGRMDLDSEGLSSL